MAITENEMMEIIRKESDQYDLKIDDIKEMYADEIKELSEKIRSADDWTDVMEDCREICRIADVDNLFDNFDENWDFELFMQCVGKFLGVEIY